MSFTETHTNMEHTLRGIGTDSATSWSTCYLTWFYPVPSQENTMLPERARPLLQVIPKIFLVVSSFQVFWPKFCMHFPSLPCVLHAQAPRKFNKAHCKMPVNYVYIKIMKHSTIRTSIHV